MRKRSKYKHSEEYEEILLSYTAMCYSVALALTRNPYYAHYLAQDVLIWAWHLRYNADCKKNIKFKLLKKLRERFQKNYFQVSFRPTGVPTPRKEALNVAKN